MEKMFSMYDVFAIIDEAIKNEMDRKNKYIANNGYTHKETLNSFDQRIAAFSELYGRFKNQ